VDKAGGISSTGQVSEAARPGILAAAPGVRAGPSANRRRPSCGEPGAVEELGNLREEVVRCRRCPRLVAWREKVAREKRASYRDERYWGRPVPGFGDPEASVLVVGLAPAAHGANRTGRMFTGDRAGDWLYRAMHRAGFANRPLSRDRDDGLVLRGAYVTAGVRCAPPRNRPTAEERDRCAPFLRREAEILWNRLHTIVALGGFAHSVALGLLAQRGVAIPTPRPRFGHGAEVDLGKVVLLGSYHPSQQNTFTGKLTEEMFDSVWRRTAKRAARRAREERGPGPGAAGERHPAEGPSGSCEGS